jgi:hypothetical protein
MIRPLNPCAVDDVDEVVVERLQPAIPKATATVTAALTTEPSLC